MQTGEKLISNEFRSLVMARRGFVDSDATKTDNSCS